MRREREIDGDLWSRPQGEGAALLQMIFFPFANFLLLLRVAFSPLQKHYSSILCPPFPLPAASAPQLLHPSPSSAGSALISQQLWLQHQASLLIVLWLLQTTAPPHLSFPPQSLPWELAALLMILDHTMTECQPRGGRRLRADEKIHCECVAPSHFFPLRGTGFAPGSWSLCLGASAVSDGCSAALPPQPSLFPASHGPALAHSGNILSPALSLSLFFPVICPTCFSL